MQNPTLLNKFKLKLINAFKSFINNIKTNWKKILVLYAILLTTFTIFLLIDQLTKEFLFDPNKEWNKNDPSTFKDYKIIGIRSVWHDGVTFIEDANIGLIQTLSIIIVVILLLTPLFSDLDHFNFAILFVMVFGIMMAGDLGNAIDRFRFQKGVKDIFYLPWKDTGTFNFADTSIFFSIGSIITLTIVKVIYEYAIDKKQKN
ncbi:signal peptidase II [Mycoplasma sp. NEAQ87857]|uniref:signal peptidase II n=1 Tax=Mycoplasma sp. NEAQ87857 TaxID=2683967 RepID=UPI00131D1A11|nr:signal peptidase II [Mycoplasma sp. NEAQ87857]